jgi:hypothetical protein
MLRPFVARNRSGVTRLYVRAVLRVARAAFRPVLRVARAAFRPVLRVARATFRPVLRVARATFRPVLRAVRAVLRAVVFLVAIVFLPFCFDVAICPFRVRFIDNASLFSDFAVAPWQVNYFWRSRLKCYALPVTSPSCPTLLIGEINAQIARRRSIA